MLVVADRTSLVVLLDEDLDFAKIEAPLKIAGRSHLSASFNFSQDMQTT